MSPLWIGLRILPRLLTKPRCWWCFTDSSGPEAYNLGLSKRRAVSVQNYLEGKGVGGAQLEPRGMGEASPVATNDTEDGRARNRRVELISR